MFTYKFYSYFLITISYSFLPSSISHSLSLFFSVFLLCFQTLSSHNEDSKVMQSASLFNKASNWNSFCQNNAFTITDFTLIRFLNLPISLGKWEKLELHLLNIWAFKSVEIQPKYTADILPKADGDNNFRLHQLQKVL